MMNGQHLYALHALCRKAQGWTTDSWASLSIKERRTWDNMAQLLMAWRHASLPAPEPLAPVPFTTEEPTV